ncbi:unnamed protein product [Tuber melanosporum]|uniref:(Perigord truffle) hypothetical protein n=1 Tax=Tuber melanosporum (strain Mel28) TaxID=656061 RepID=D5G4M2_TUBMM|nr:uncharacterized protein GSTUM_00000007001 [Tuber melanosporum]CAZ79465.1 unnamed protein product [Tuber melanosporum]
MSASVASKNLFDLLGNDIEDPDAPPPPPPREVIKNSTTSKKRVEKFATGDFATGGSPPSGNTTGGHGRPYSGNERAFRDRDAGRQNNLGKETTEGAAPRGGYRSGRGGRREYDRHSATGRTDSDKKYNQGWGDTRGSSEWNDELVGEELAQKDASGTDPADPNAAAPADAPPGDEEAEEVAPEPEEEKVKTLDEYRAELEQRRDGLGPPTEVRRPNEGTKNDKKWAGKELSRKVEEEDVFFAGESREKTRTRERKQKYLLEFETRYSEPRENRRGGDRGGRGRGDRGRGRGGGDRRSDNYHRGGQKPGGHVNVADESAFPALGSKNLQAAPY